MTLHKLTSGQFTIIQNIIQSSIRGDRTMLVEDTAMSQTKTYPLTFAKRGESVILKEVRAGKRLRKRLGEIGLNPGMTVRIVQPGTHGPIIVAVTNDSRLAVGQGMAQKIMVTPAQKEI